MTVVAHPVPSLTPQPLRRRALWSILAVVSGAVGLLSYRYLAGVGVVPPGIAANSRFDPWIVVHATSAATALIVGPWQFLPRLRQRKPGLHRIVGSIYVAGCALGGLSGLVLATGVSTGPIAAVGFGMLSIAWLVTTGAALRHILMGNVPLHCRWMIRSFALTLAAVTLRIDLVLSMILGLDPTISYRAIAWLCWLPNLLIAELYLRRIDPVPSIASSKKEP